MANKLLKGNANTIEVVAAADIAAGTFAFEGTILVWYQVAVASGEIANPLVANTNLEIDKTDAATVYAVGDNVELDATTQKSVATAGTVGGYAAKASANGDATVVVRMNAN